MGVHEASNLILRDRERRERGGKREKGKKETRKKTLIRVDDFLV